MFDIGFQELLIIAVLALLILGPERLPTALRTLALWIGRIKRSLHSARVEIEQQIGADDIRRQLYNEEVMRQHQQQQEPTESATQSSRESSDSPRHDG